MATRLYLTRDSASYNPSTLRGSWNGSSSNIWRMHIVRGNPGATSYGITETSASVQDEMIHKFVSEPLGAGYNFTGSDTVQWMMAIQESDATSGMFFHLHIYVTQGDADTVRGTLLADNIGATEWPTAYAGKGEGTKSLGTVSAQKGDRLVAEVGYRAQNTVTTSYTGNIYSGGASPTDLTDGDTNIAHPGWIEFSPTLTIPYILSAYDRIIVSDPNLYNKFDTNNVVGIQGGTASSGENAQGYAQQFTAVGTSLTGVGIKLFKFGSPSDNIIATITSSAGGSSLGSKSIATSSLSSGSVNNFVFDTPITLTSGTKYFIQVTRDGVRDTTNKWSWYIDFATSWYNGGDLYQLSNTAWAVYSTTSDTHFIAYFSDSPVVTTFLTISVNDTVHIAEFVNPGQPLLSVAETVTISEGVVVTPVSLISVSDLVSHTESVSTTLFKTVNVHDNVTTTEFKQNSSNWGVLVVDTVTVAENMTFRIPVLFLNTHTDIFVEDSATRDTTFDVDDVVSVTDTPIMLIDTYAVVVSDTVTLYEEINIGESVNWGNRDGELSIWTDVHREGQGLWSVT